MHTNSLQLSKIPKMRTQMLIRRPADDVFEAFANPAITSKFWFSKGSAPLRQGAKVTWEWAMYGVSTEVLVVDIKAGSHIKIKWGNVADGYTQVQWLFAPHKGGTTLVTITEEGFTGTADVAVAKALGSMGGFSYLLAGAKAWLEQGVTLRLVEDHAPLA
jgi:uncharacterized protein YndB with AHSA1/START domain